MTILQMNTKDFFAYLEKEGAKKFSDHPDEDIVVYEFQDTKVPIQIRAMYNPCYVVKICEYLKIPCPPDFKKVANQLDEARKMARKKEE